MPCDLNLFSWWWNWSWLVYVRTGRADGSLAGESVWLFCIFRTRKQFQNGTRIQITITLFYVAAQTPWRSQECRNVGRFIPPFSVFREYLNLHLVVRINKLIISGKMYWLKLISPKENYRQLSKTGRRIKFLIMAPRVCKHVLNRAAAGFFYFVLFCNLESNKTAATNGKTLRNTLFNNLGMLI